MSSTAAERQSFQLLLDGVSRLGGAKALVDVSATLIDTFKPDELPPEHEELLQRIIKKVLICALDERNASLAILGEQGIDARQMLASIEAALREVDDADPR